MREQIEVVYENGVLRPLGTFLTRAQEHQHFTVTIEGPVETDSWLAGADPTVSLEIVRRVLSQMPGTLAQQVIAEREER